MRVLVTGGTGFVGSAVVRALLARGDQVVCLVRAGANRANLLDLPVEYHVGDLHDASSLREALAGCQQLYHVAALYSSRPEDAPELQRVNVEGTRRLLTLAAELGLERIVHTSTIGTIGQPGGGRLATEADHLSAEARLSAYARSKLQAEEIALALARQGAPVVVVNPCGPIGPRDMRPSSTGQRILDYLAGKTPSWPPGGINLVAVDDVAEGHLLASCRGRAGERYILGNARGNLDLAAFYRLMAEISGVEPPGQQARGWPRRLARGMRKRLAHAKAEPAGFRPLALTADPSRAIGELGMPQTPLEAALDQAITWFVANGYLGRRLR